jgi:hypothetical protein
VHENHLMIRSEDVVNFGLPGYVHLATFEETVLDKLGEPHNSCDENTDVLRNPLADEMAARGSGYSQSLCFNLCILHYIEIKCDCSLEYQLWSNGSDTCRDECVMGVLDSFDYTKMCTWCPVKCDSVLLELQLEKQRLSDMKYFGDIIKIEMNKTNNKFSNYTFEALTERLILLNLKFWKPHNIEIREMPKTTFSSLIGDLGGTIGNYIIHSKIRKNLQSFFLLFLLFFSNLKESFWALASSASWKFLRRFSRLCGCLWRKIIKIKKPQ